MVFVILFKSRYSWALAVMASFVNFDIMSSVEADIRIDFSATFFVAVYTRVRCDCHELSFMWHRYIHIGTKVLTIFVMPTKATSGDNNATVYFMAVTNNTQLRLL